MRAPVLSSSIIVMLLFATGCNPGWKQAGGAQTLSGIYFHHPTDLGILSGAEVKAPEADQAIVSRRVAFALPDGWYWVMRGDDFVATRDGVFLQNIIIERIHVAQVEQSDGMYPMAAFSSKQWPVRTAKYLKKRFTTGMSPKDAADVVLSSRANNAGIIDLKTGEITVQSVAGYRGFKTMYDFRVDIEGRKTPYRTLSYGFMLDDWFYGISYTAAQHYYFQKDEDTFNLFLQSFRVIEK